MGRPTRIPEVPQPLSSARIPFTKATQPQPTATSATNFSIVVGGPIYDFLLRSRWVQEGLPNVTGRLLALVAVTWLPLLLLSLQDGVAFGQSVRVPFLYDFAAYG